MINIKLYCLLSFLLLLIACNKNQTTEATVQSGEIIPLKVGNTWTTKYTSYDSLGNTIRTSLDSFKIVRDTLIENEKWFSPTSLISNTHYCNRGDGYYTRYQEFGSTDKSITLLWKYPAIISDSFYIPDTYIFVVSTSDPIVVAAGNFVCLQYKWKYTGWPYQKDVGYGQAWICPNVGIIKSLGYHQLPSGKLFLEYSSELIYYNLY